MSANARGCALFPIANNLHLWVPAALLHTSTVTRDLSSFTPEELFSSAITNVTTNVFQGKLPQ